MWIPFQRYRRTSDYEESWVTSKEEVFEMHQGSRLSVNGEFNWNFQFYSDNTSWLVEEDEFIKLDEKPDHLKLYLLKSEEYYNNYEEKDIPDEIEEDNYVELKTYSGVLRDLQFHEFFIIFINENPQDDIDIYLKGNFEYTYNDTFFPSWLTIPINLALIGIPLGMLGSIESSKKKQEENENKILRDTHNMKQILEFERQNKIRPNPTILVRDLNFNIEDAKYYSSLLSDPGNPPVVITDLQNKAMKVLKSVDKPTVYKLMTQLNYDFYTAYTVGTYLLKEGFIDSFPNTEASTSVQFTEPSENVELVDNHVEILEHTNSQENIQTPHKQAVESNTYGVLALISGIFSFLFGFLFGPLAIIFGIVGIKRYQDKTLSIIGLVLGVIGFFVFLVLFFILILPFLIAAGILSAIF